MTFGSSPHSAWPPASAQSCGPGWHMFNPPVAVGYSSGNEWVEVIELPVRSGMTVEQVAACFVETGLSPSRAGQQALDLEDAHERLDLEVQRLTALSAFRNAFMRSARGDFRDPIATTLGVELVRPVTAWYEDESLADGELLDSGSVVFTVYGATFEGALGSRTIPCGRVDDIELSMQFGTIRIDGWTGEWYLRNVSANGLAALYALKHIDTDIALRGTVRYVEGWLDDPEPDPGDVRHLLRAAKLVRQRSPQTTSYVASQRRPAASLHRSPSPQGSSVGTGGAMPIVDFFLDEESMPMPLCVVHDVDGPDELEVWLGTFLDKTDAMSAVDTVRKFLQEDAMRWASVPEALAASQLVAQRCRGNLGLPEVARSEIHVEAADARPDLASKVLASAVFAEQRERARRLILTDQQIESLLRKLLTAPGHRVSAESAAAALGIPLMQLNGALPMAQRLLNVEQFRVLERDSGSGAIMLDVDLLKEQFGVTQ